MFWFVIESASGGVGALRSLERGDQPSSRTGHQIAQVIKKYAPSEPAPEYIAGYEADGHTPEVAIEKGVIRETVSKQNEWAADSDTLAAFALLIADSPPRSPPTLSRQKKRADSHA